MWFNKKKKAEVTGELPIELTPSYSYSGKPSGIVRTNTAYWSHVGMVRQNNEDSFSYSEELVFTYNEPTYIAIAVIADGMGGLDLGEEASSGAVTMFSNLLKSRILQEIREKKVAVHTEIENLLKSVVIEINEKLYDYFQTKNGRSGSTLSAAVMFSDQCHIVHVGDSRIYLVDRNEKTIQQVTTDHSYVSRLVQMGQLSPAEAKTHPRKNEIYKMLAFERNVEPDYVSIKLSANQRLLFCTDGLTDMLSDEEILEHALTAETMQEAVDSLGHLANRRGGYDNCTILYVEPIYS